MDKYAILCPLMSGGFAFLIAICVYTPEQWDLVALSVFFGAIFGAIGYTFSDDDKDDMFKDWEQ